MDVLVSLLFWIHLVSLAVAGVAIFGMPVVGRSLGTASAEGRPALFALMKRFSTMGRAALVLLLITGPLIFWLRYGWTAPNVWFHVKMALVVLQIAVVVFAGINARRAQGGDAAAAQRGAMIGTAGMVVFVLLILSAVFAFG